MKSWKLIDYSAVRNELWDNREELREHVTCGQRCGISLLIY